MREQPAHDSVQSSLFPEPRQREPRRRPPQPQRRTRPGRGVASCKCQQPEGVAFCHSCGRLILPAEPKP